MEEGISGLEGGGLAGGGAWQRLLREARCVTSGLHEVCRNQIAIGCTIAGEGGLRVEPGRGECRRNGLVW
jgi:hypothetical protein